MWGFLGGLAGAAGSLFGGLSQQKQSKRQFQWAQEAQRHEWARQDNQLQRMVKDARSAGISPLAALGQGNYAQPTQTPSGSAVDPYSNAASQLGSAIAGIQTKNQRENAELQNELLRAQISNVKANTMDQMTRAARVHTASNSNNVRQDGSAPGRSTVRVLSDGTPVVVKNPEQTEKIEADYGGLVGEMLGLSNYLQDRYKQWSSQVTNPETGRTYITKEEF